MDYRNRYRRGGIIGLQEGGSWWDRMVSSLKRKELDPSGLSGDGGYMGSQYGEDPSYSVPGVPEADAHMDDPNWMNLGPDRGGSKYVRELRDRTPEEAPLPPWMEKEAARKRDIRDNWMYGLDGPPPPPPSVLEADAHMDDPNWMDLGKDEERRKKLVRDDQARILNEMMPAADTEEAATTAEEAATTQAIAAAEAASGPPLAIPPTRSIREEMEDPYTWRVGGDHGIPGSFANDAMIQNALAERNMTGQYALDDPLAGLMMSPDAPQSREEILARRSPPTRSIREEMEDPYTWRVGGDYGVPGSFANDAMIQNALREREMFDPLAGLMMSPDAPQSREEILAKSFLGGPPITDLLMEDLDPAVMRDKITQPAYTSPRELRALEDYKDLILNPPSESGLRLPEEVVGPESEYPSAITDLLMEDMDPRRIMEGVTQPPYMSPRELRALEDYKDLILNPPDQSGLALPGDSSYWDSMGFADGGYIPGYGLGGFLKKALTLGAGAWNPALGAGVGGLMGLLDKKNRGKGFLKGALAGGLAGLATSKLAGGGK